MRPGDASISLRGRDVKICLKKIDLREIQLPLKEAFEISSGSVKTRRILLLRLEGADGEIAWSECVAEESPNYYPDTTDTARIAIRDWIAPLVLDRDFDGPEGIYDMLEERIRGHPMAKASVEMGMWGLTAEVRQVSLSQLLGGTRDKVPVGISIGIRKSPEELVARVQQCVRQGYKKIKMKIKPGKDIEYVRAVRAAVGPDVPLMVDANNAYTLDDLPRLKQLDEFGLMMIEQPLAWDDLLRHARLQKEVKTPICLDESISNLERAEDMIALGSGRIINIKPGRVGGFTSSVRIHDLCERHGVPVWCGGMLESGVGRSYNVALASLPNFTLPGDISPSARYWERDIVTPEWTMESDGFIRVPSTRKGIGVTVDLDMVDRLTVWSDTISKR
jgi:O-succinylbenzoate synthase